MNTELISIIVPVYNVEKFLPKCLDSIINQTYSNIEIILIDDGSTDNSGKICDEYAQNDKRIIVIHKENGGVSSARNIGLKTAKGEYISFIDSDDFVENNFEERMLFYCKKNNVDIVECATNKLNNIVLKDKCDFENDSHTISFYEGEKLQIRLCEDVELRCVLWNKIYKKYVFNDIVFPDGKINEDEAMIAQILYKCITPMAVTNERLYNYRTTPQSIMNKRFNHHRLDIIEALENRLFFYLDKSMFDAYSTCIIKFENRLKYCYLLTRKYVKNNKKYLNLIISKSRKYIKYYLKSNIPNLSSKIKMTFFIIFPNVYSIMCKAISGE